MANETLITALQDAKLYDHEVKNFSVLETHCSWVILAGYYAYKIKKPVDFGFLNYTSLAKRKHYCEEEMKRNQLLAKQIYLNIVPVYGTVDKPNFNGRGDVIEYAVKMHQFPQENLLSNVQKQGRLTGEIIDKLATRLAHFHATTNAVPQSSIIGNSEHTHQQIRDNFTQTLPLLENEADQQELQQLSNDVKILYQKVKPVIDRRKASGFVKQCHGDVHLNNIVLLNNEPIIFDCIDFNDDFCWTDTMADLGFITMDLDEFGETHFSWRLLNHYLQISGDYDGLQVLPYFQSYRAMVRAKVAMISLANTTAPEKRAEYYRRYKGCVALAKAYLQPKKAKLLLTCGVSASGKSTLAQQLSNALNLVTLASDRERKRQANITLQDDCSAPVSTELYSQQQTEQTYGTLLKLSKTILAAGCSLIVDATFREYKHRQTFARLAQQINVPFIILYCHAKEKQLRRRLSLRQQQAQSISDATQEVLTLSLIHI